MKPDDLPHFVAELHEAYARGMTKIHEQLSALLSLLRHNQRKVQQVVTSLDALTKAVNDTIAFLNQVAKDGGIPQSAVDTLATNLTTALSAAAASVNPPAPAPAPAA